jgi:hypothetical protein
MGSWLNKTATNKESNGREDLVFLNKELRRADDKEKKC